MKKKEKKKHVIYIDVDYFDFPAQCEQQQDRKIPCGMELGTVRREPIQATCT